MDSLLGFLGLNELFGLFFRVVMSVKIKFIIGNLIYYCSVIFIYYLALFFYIESNEILLYSGFLRKKVRNIL